MKKIEDVIGYKFELINIIFNNSMSKDELERLKEKLSIINTALKQYETTKTIDQESIEDVNNYLSVKKSK